MVNGGGTSNASVGKWFGRANGPNHLPFTIHHSLSLKPDLHVAEGDHVAVLDVARLAVGEAAAVDEGAVGRAGVGDQKRPFAVHDERGVDLRDARVFELEVVVGEAADAQAAPARPELQDLLAR